MSEILGEHEWIIPNDKTILNLFKEFKSDKFHVEGNVIWHKHHWLNNGVRQAALRVELEQQKKQIVARTLVLDKLIAGLQKNMQGLSSENAKSMALHILKSNSKEAALKFGITIEDFHILKGTHTNINTKLII